MGEFGQKRHFDVLRGNSNMDVQAPTIHNKSLRPQKFASGKPLKDTFVLAHVDIFRPSL